MEILSNNHLKTIKEINQITNDRVFYGGSLEDYLLLGESEKPIGDLDVLIYDTEIINVLSEYYDLTEGKGSYFNRFMSEKFTKYNTHINGIKIDFLVSDSELEKDKFTTTMVGEVTIPHRTFSFKTSVLLEWIEKSIPEDLWAYEKFSKILLRYEGTDNQ